MNSRSLDLRPKHYLKTNVPLHKEVFSNIDLINQSVLLHCWFFSAFWYQIIYFFANFSPFPPFSAKFHLYRTNINYFWQLFFLYNMNEPSWALFKNMVFGSYCLYPWSNWKNLWMGNIDFVSYINYHYRFGCTLAQFLGNFSWYAKCEVWGKIPR